MVESVIQIKSGITIDVHESPKNITHVKKIIFGILTHGSCEIGKYLASIFSVITCNEIIDAEAKSYDEETKTVTANFN